MWLRSQTNLVVLAFFALVGQVLFAPSHQHGPRVGHHIDAAFDSPTDGESRKEHVPLHRGDEECPFCWMMDSVGNAVVTPLPTVPAPAATAKIANEAFALFEFKPRCFVSFQARAPPQYVTL
jgi:hypothetical protein